MALPILTYIVEAEEVSGSHEFRRLTVPGDQLQVVLEHLSEETSWRFRVAATNAAGEGEFSEWTEPVSPLPPEVEPPWEPEPPPPGAVIIPDPFAPIPRAHVVTPHVLSWARWRDFEFGDGTPWEFANERSRLALAALPGVRTGDTDRNQQDGLYAGEDYLEGRAATVDLRRLVCSGATEAVEDLVRELWVSRSEGELEINGDWTLISRPRAQDPDAPFWYSKGGAFLNTSVRFEAADPLIYGREQDSGWVGLADWEEEGRSYGPPDVTDQAWDGLTPEGEPEFSRQYPQDGSGWTYPGEGRRGGRIVIENPGTLPSWRIRGQIVGPVLNPQLVHVQRQERIALGIELLAGQAIDLEWWNGRILLAGANRYLAITTRSRWWPIDGTERRGDPPRLNTIRFIAARFDREAAFRMWWRPAY